VALRACWKNANALSEHRNGAVSFSASAAIAAASAKVSPDGSSSRNGYSRLTCGIQRR
jgi:hypothetical protein